MMQEELDWRSGPPSINDIPWDELQAYRCKDAEPETWGGLCPAHVSHKYTLGGRAFLVPEDILATYARDRINGTEPFSE